MSIKRRPTHTFTPLVDCLPFCIWMLYLGLDTQSGTTNAGLRAIFPLRGFINSMDVL